MTNHDFSNTVMTTVIIFTFAVSVFVILVTKEKKKTPLPKEPRRPIGAAYMEIFDKIYEANEVADMNCVKPLLKDYMQEYQRHQSPQLLQQDYITLKRMRLDKISELRGRVSNISTV